MTTDLASVRVRECIESPPSRSSDQPTVRLAVTGDGPPYELHIRLVWTAQPTGGYRWWFTCPGCERRCGVLYVGGPRFLACRVCLHLNYPSQRIGYERRMTAKVDYWLARVGCSRDDQFHYKPKGMHWRTFDHALAQASEASQRANRSVGMALDRRVA